MKQGQMAQTLALEGLVGAALVLDEAGRVVLATSAAEKLLRQRVSLGVAVADVFGGRRAARVLTSVLDGANAAVVSTHDGVWVHLRAIRYPTTAPRSFTLLLEAAPQSVTSGPIQFHGMWTQDARVKEVFRVIERVAADNDTVLVRGETGSGKELAATAIHALSARRKGPLRIINCAALPSNLLESELFGHVRGSFTGAHRDMPGHFRLAHKGTLFLDEVGELPLDVQAKLLRVLETHSVLPIGGREPVPVDVRVVSATHRALRKEVEAGRFRADLLYRLRVIPIFLPPLRDRLGDLPLLCEKIILDMNPGRRRKMERVAPAAMEALMAHTWPGNVRELRNVLAYAYATGDGPVLVADDLPPEITARGAGSLEGPRGEGEGEDESVANGEAERIRAALREAKGSRERAAHALGMSRVTLWRRMRELGLGRSRS